MTLSADEKAIVTSTFQAVAKDLNQSGVDLFIKLFEAQPSYKELFPFKDVADLQQLRTDDRYKKHVSNVMNLLAKLVASLDNDAEVKQLLDGFAVTHIPRNLTAAHFENVKVCLVAILKDSLGADVVNAQADAAWGKTLGLFAQVLA